jgi:hypothetical protein
MTTINRTILVVLFCLISLVQTRAAEPQKDAEGLYIVSIHYGSKNLAEEAKKNAQDAQKLALALAKLGYSVREPDAEQNVVSGPGVEYSSPESKNEADKVVGLVKISLPSLNLTSRPGNAKGSLYVRYSLDVWLY